MPCYQGAILLTSCFVFLHPHHAYRQQRCSPLFKGCILLLPSHKCVCLRSSFRVWKCCVGSGMGLICIENHAELEHHNSLRSLRNKFTSLFRVSSHDGPDGVFWRCSMRIILRQVIFKGMGVCGKTHHTFITPATVLSSNPLPTPNSRVQPCTCVVEHFQETSYIRLLIWTFWKKTQGGKNSKLKGKTQ